METAIKLIDSYLDFFVYSLLLALVLGGSNDVLELLSRHRGEEIELWMLLLSLFWVFILCNVLLRFKDNLGWLAVISLGSFFMLTFGGGGAHYVFLVSLVMYVNVLVVRALPDFYQKILKAVNAKGMCPRDRDLYLVGSFIMFFVVLVLFDYLFICM